MIQANFIKKLFIRKESIFNEDTQQIEISNKEKFKRIMQFAEKVLKNSKTPKFYEHPIIDVIRLIGRNLQTEYLTSLLTSTYETDLESLYPEVVFFKMTDAITNDKKFWDFLKETNLEKKIDLSKDLVLPWPWRRDRLINCIVNIGKGRPDGEWEEDEYNHQITLWLPMGIAWVDGGNHSIATGIIQGKGIVRTSMIYDLSELYNYVYCDGDNYYRSEDNSIICSVKNVEFAAIFEIGRLMKRESILPW